MAIEVKTDIDAMSALELEIALGVSGAATRWDSFGHLLTEFRVSLAPTTAWGTGNGVSDKRPGWIATIENLGTVVIDTDPLIAGCKCLLMEYRKRKWDSAGKLIPSPFPR